MAQDHPEVISRRDQIVSLVAPEDSAIVRETTWFMIYDLGTRTWGLVNAPQEGFIEVRLRNQSSPQLRKSCERFVTDIYGDNLRLSPNDIIEVLEPNSQHQAFFGQPLPVGTKQKFALARAERRAEWLLGIFFSVLALLLMIITTPPFRSMVTMPPGWIDWSEGILGRLATSALASAAVAFVSVLIHFFDLRRLGAIRWSIHPVSK